MNIAFYQLRASYGFVRSSFEELQVPVAHVGGEGEFGVDFGGDAAAVPKDQLGVFQAEALGERAVCGPPFFSDNNRQSSARDITQIMPTAEHPFSPTSVRVPYSPRCSWNCRDHLRSSSTSC